MEIIKNTNGTELTVAVEGRLDTSTAPQLDAALNESIDGMDSLILDFEKLAYVSSAGLRVLLSMQKTMAKRKGMVVRNVNDTVTEIFEVTGFIDILTIE